MRLGTDAVREPKIRVPQRLEADAIFRLSTGAVKPNGKAKSGSITETQIAGYIIRPVSKRTLDDLYDVTRSCGNAPIEINTAVQVLRPVKYTGTPFVRPERMQRERNSTRMKLRWIIKGAEVVVQPFRILPYGANSTKLDARSDREISMPAQPSGPSQVFPKRSSTSPVLEC
eukprot:IDg7651t1